MSRLRPRRRASRTLLPDLLRRRVNGSTNSFVARTTDRFTILRWWSVDRLQMHATNRCHSHDLRQAPTIRCATDSFSNLRPTESMCVVLSRHRARFGNSLALPAGRFLSRDGAFEQLTFDLSVVYPPRRDAAAFATDFSTTSTNEPRPLAATLREMGTTFERPERPSIDR